LACLGLAWFVNAIVSARACSAAHNHSSYVAYRVPLQYKNVRLPATGLMGYRRTKQQYGGGSCTI
jgi:hypothetical protein